MQPVVKEVEKLLLLLLLGLGISFQFPHLNSPSFLDPQPVEAVDIPTITNIHPNRSVVWPDEVLRLKGKGLPVFGAPMHGDLKIRLQVRIPEKLTSEEKGLYKQLRDKIRPGKKHWWE